MATPQEFVEYVCSLISNIGNVRWIKMMGEPLVYVDDRPAFLICNSTVYVKILPCLQEIMKNAEKGFPYKGAKEHYILDIDDKEKSEQVAKLVSQNTPLPKRKK